MERQDIFELNMANRQSRRRKEFHRSLIPERYSSSTKSDTKSPLLNPKVQYWLPFGIT